VVDGLVLILPCVECLLVGLELPLGHGGIALTRSGAGSSEVVQC
jgi:hypothetical protein